MNPRAPAATVPPRWVGALVVAALTFVLYGPSLSSGLVYDAEIQIAADGFIHDPRNVPAVLSLRILGEDVLDANRPVHLLSLMLDAALWGRRPFGFHLTSNLLHALNAALVFLLLARLGHSVSPWRGLVAAALGAGLFAVHPMLAEAVAEPSYREDLLATLFVLLALHAAGWFGRVETRRLVPGLACITALFLAAASKETAYVSAGLVAAYAALFHGFRPRGSWLALLGAAVLVTFGFAATQYALRVTDSAIFAEAPPRLGGSLAATLALQPRLWTFLFWQAVNPGGLSADYAPQNVAWIPPLAGFLVPTLLLVGQALLAWRSRLAAFGVVTFWLALLPVSNLFPLFRPIADRFLYLPMVGLAAIVTGAILLLRPRAVFAGATIAVALGLAALVPFTLARQAAFANSLALWEDTARKAPFSATAATNLGYARWEAGQFQPALEAYSRALQLSKENNAQAWLGAAFALLDLGHPAAARQALDRAIRLDPAFANPEVAVASLRVTPRNAEKLRVLLALPSP